MGAGTIRPNRLKMAPGAYDRLPEEHDDSMFAQQ
ncbi:hypothetical protein SNOG_10715 [Parastagonospora nodorum SN15]|uniref:Uncharacterized protein n=1 Tax=Phaeosphaeria nodorum (strain SN15 / ATCC MYA-4574 / FGSC 10173) TaxID=321614 RepID=Q0UBZ9_PHANO|nr:hypothetical protein SNOG_10715 [Parastagonospora nodorum SN15]EAT82109.1 hypothetical protein SNOG_10715 [Parastagonospora nodorum SN15]